MAKQAFIALLFFLAIWTAPSVKAEAVTPRKLVEDQKVEKLIKLPQDVMVPNADICYAPDFDQCGPGCICIVHPIWPPPETGICGCPRTLSLEAKAETLKKSVEIFQDQTLEKLIKLPEGVRVSGGGSCTPPNYDECDPDCICIVHPIWPPRPGICACPLPQTHEAAREMVTKFQDQTVTEKLIKLPQRVGVPNGGKCLPPDLVCDPGCFCIQPRIWPPRFGTCAGSCA